MEIQTQSVSSFEAITFVRSTFFFIWLDFLDIEYTFVTKC